MKNFDGWNKKKKDIHQNAGAKMYHPRDIWWCILGTNVGFEQDGKDPDFQRPVLILKGLSKETCVVVPLTTSKHEHRYRINVGSVTGKESKVILSQIRVIDTKRLVNKITMLDEITFRIIRKSIKDML